MRLVEHDNFRRPLFLVAPEYTVPSRTTITTRIEQMYDTEETSWTSNLKWCKSVSLNTDTWTLTSTEPYLPFIDDDWVLRSNVPMTQGMRERHISANLPARLTDCVDKFHLNGGHRRVSTCVST